MYGKAGFALLCQRVLHRISLPPRSLAFAEEMMYSTLS